MTILRNSEAFFLCASPLSPSELGASARSPLRLGKFQILGMSLRVFQGRVEHCGLPVAHCRRLPATPQ